MSDYMRRFCSQLGIKRRDVNACTEVADNAVPREGTTRYSIHIADLLCMRFCCKNAGVPLLMFVPLQSGILGSRSRVYICAGRETLVACK